MKYLAILLVCFTLQTAIAQQTVGLFENDSLAYNGYTLMSPMSSTTSYLLDNCGRVVNTWQGSSLTTFSAYLLEDGSLLRPCRGIMGLPNIIERYSWEGDLLWSYTYIASGNLGQHHDIKPMPNGNILVLSIEEVTYAEAINAGRDPDLIDDILWAEHIVELQPLGNDSAIIVWEWHVMDHLIQEYDSTKANYGTVIDHPELMNINYVGIDQPGSYTDWLHANYIDYNPQLDQVMINFRNTNEFWVMDHSTTTAEAASSTDGNSGKGGDILYRWGNPQSYNRGTEADQKFYLQHNSHWIPEGKPGAGNILVFNNGNGRPGGNYSSIEELITPVDAFGNYESLASGQAYGPLVPTWIYEDGPSFFALRISGTERQPNGNTLICQGFAGNLFEVDNDSNIHWDYINPIANNFPLPQGDAPFGNSIFTVRRYSVDYPGLVNQDLVPGAVLELNPLIGACQIYEEEVTASDSPFGEYSLIAYPIPADHTVKIEYATHSLSTDLRLEIISQLGEVILNKKLSYQNDFIEINVKNWSPGIYFYRIQADKPSIMRKFVVLH